MQPGARCGRRGPPSRTGTRTRAGRAGRDRPTRSSTCWPTCTRSTRARSGWTASAGRRATWPGSCGAGRASGRRCGSADLPAVDELAAELAARLPAGPSGPVVHGDYKLDNVVLDPADPGRIAAVLDWEMSTLGDPLADLGLLLVYWQPDAAAGVVPSVTACRASRAGADVVARYAARTGRDVCALPWYVAFGYFKLACVVAGIVVRQRAGAMVDNSRDGLGDQIGPLAEAGRAALATQGGRPRLRAGVTCRTPVRNDPDPGRQRSPRRSRPARYPQSQRDRAQCGRARWRRAWGRCSRVRTPAARRGTRSGSVGRCLRWSSCWCSSGLAGLTWLRVIDRVDDRTTAAACGTATGRELHQDPGADLQRHRPRRAGQADRRPAGRPRLRDRRHRQRPAGRDPAGRQPRRGAVRAGWRQAGRPGPPAGAGRDALPGRPAGLDRRPGAGREVQPAVHRRPSWPAGRQGLVAAAPSKAPAKKAATPARTTAPSPASSC